MKVLEQDSSTQIIWRGKGGKEVEREETDPDWSWYEWEKEERHVSGSEYGV